MVSQRELWHLEYFGINPISTVLSSAAAATPSSRIYIEYGKVKYNNQFLIPFIDVK